MKKILLAAAALLVIAACLPLTSAPNPTPNVNLAATSGANVQTAVVQTLTAQPTATSLPPSNTVEAPSATSEALLADTPSASPTMTVTTAATETVDPALTGTFAVPTSTNISGTLPTSVPAGQVTPTWTLAVRTYGTLPPQVPFGRITLINKAKAEAYISLHVDLDGSNTVIEYPVEGTIVIRAPLGFYRYVAWVGGREMVGEFKLQNDRDLSITLYKDRVVVQ